MICPFCSLLCDADDLNEIQCDRRSSSLSLFELSQDTNKRLLPEADRLKSARESLRQAKRVLVAGRIASVATARAAIAFAAKFNATLDLAESGSVFRNVLAIQRVGIYSVSLAEARDHTDLFIVVGDDSIHQTVPRMPNALSRGASRKQTVLLLGTFSIAGVEVWRNAGFEVWSVQCDLNEVPKALSQWSKWSDDRKENTVQGTSMSGPLFHRLSNAGYTTVVWCSKNLPMEQADLWVERMIQWIAKRNEETRCAAIPWASFDGTFVQVCTWLTGFPGRVAFRNGAPEYDPQKFTYERWIEQTSMSRQVESVVVLIDETIAASSFFTPLEKQLLNCSTVIELTGNSELFPTSIAGLETGADMFRADQTLLAHVSPTSKREPFGKPASIWLQGLST